MSLQLATGTCSLIKDQTHTTPYPALVYPIYQENGELDPHHLGGINLYGESEWYDLKKTIEFQPTAISNEVKQYLLRCYHQMKSLDWFSPYRLAEDLEIMDQESFHQIDFKCWFNESCRQYCIFPVHTGHSQSVSFVWNDYVLTPSFPPLTPLMEQTPITLTFRYTCPIEAMIHPNQYDFLTLQAEENCFFVKDIQHETEQYQTILLHYQRKIMNFESLKNLPFVQFQEEVQHLTTSPQTPLLFEHILRIQLTSMPLDKLSFLKQLNQLWKKLMRLN